jgi:DivIVA domain-containing protein
MLVPNKIKDIQFSRAVRGYKDTEVDEFLNQISKNYSEIYKENAELVRKLEILAEKLEEYRSDEENMRLVLVKIQKLAETKIKEANIKADLAIKSADIKAERIILEAKKEVEKERRNYEKLQFEATRFKQKLNMIYHTHMDLINNMPSVEISAQDTFNIAVLDSDIIEPTKEVSPKVEVTEAFKLVNIKEIPEIKSPEPIINNAISDDNGINNHKEIQKPLTLQDKPLNDSHEKPANNISKKFAINLFDNDEDDEDDVKEAPKQLEVKPDPRQEIEEHPKFGKLKFGADYDLTDEDSEKHGGFFNKKR